MTVITCAPNFPKGRVFDGYQNRLWQREQMAGIDVIRVWSYITANEGFTRRVLDYVSFMVTASVASLFTRKVDVVVGTSPQFFTACAAYAVGRLKRRPWVFELRDIWPESIRVVGAMKESAALDFLEKVELFLYRKASAIVSVTHAFKDTLIRRGIDGQKIEVVTNGVDTGRFVSRPKDLALVQQHRLEGKFVAGYIGTHGMAHGLDTVLDAAKMMKTAPDGDRYRFLLLGDGANKSALINRAQREQLDNVIFVDSVPKDDVVRYWSLLDAALIHLKASDLFETVIPSKMFECMGMAIPILHGVRGESARIVQDNRVGLTFEPENPTDLCDRLRQLHDDPALCQQIKAQGPTAAKGYDRRVLATNMLGILENVCTQQRGGQK